MEARPHPLIEKTVSVLFPPLAREAVMGDLSERYRAPVQYLLESLGVLPLVLAGQIRRTTTCPALGVQTLILFGCMGGFEIAGAPRDVPLWLRAAIPTTAAMLILILRDAYRRVDGWSAGRALRDIFSAVGVVAFCQLIAMALAAAGLASPGWVFAPSRVLVMGLAILPALFVFRLGLGLDGDSRLQEPAGALSAAELRADYARFRVRVRSRNLLEVGIYGLGALGGALFLSFAPGMEGKVLHWSWPLGQALVSWYLLTAASARSMPGEGPFAVLAAFYHKEIARQRRHVRIIWWWYLWPLCIGVGLPAFRRAGDSLSFALLGFASCALVTAFVAWFTANRARDFQDEMNNLASVQERS